MPRRISEALRCPFADAQGFGSGRQKGALRAIALRASALGRRDGGHPEAKPKDLKGSESLEESLVRS